MPRPYPHIIALPLVVLLLASAACMPRKRAGNMSPPSDRVPAARAATERALEQGDFRTALELSALACLNSPADPRLHANYRRAVETVLHAADEAFDQADFSTSGRAYYELLNNYTRYQRLNRQAAIDRELIRARLADSGTILAQHALADYRKGDLAGAIALWKKVLAFDPQNTDVRRSVDTATIQLKSLEQRTD